MKVHGRVEVLTQKHILCQNALGQPGVHKNHIDRCIGDMKMELFTKSQIALRRCNC